MLFFSVERDLDLVDLDLHFFLFSCKLACPLSSLSESDDESEDEDEPEEELDELDEHEELSE